MINNKLILALTIGYKTFLLITKYDANVSFPVFVCFFFSLFLLTGSDKNNFGKAINIKYLVLIINGMETIHCIQICFNYC